MTAKKALTNLWHYLRHYKWSLTAAMLLLVLHTIMTVVEPVVLGLIITELTRNIVDIVRGVEGAGINYDYVYKVLVLYFLRGVLVQISGFGANYFITNAVQNSTRDLRDDIIHKINRLPVSYFDRNQFGNILSRITSDVETITNTLQQGIMQIVNATLSITFVTIMMFYLNWILAVVMWLTMPLTILIGRKIIDKSQPYFRHQANILGKMNGYIQEYYTGFQEMRLFNQEEKSVKDFEEIIDELADVGFKSSFLSGLMMPFVSVVAHSAYLIIAVVGGILTIRGMLTIGNLQAFTQYVWQINQPIQMVTQISGLLQAAFAAVGRVWEVLDHPEEENAVTNAMPELVDGNISFEDVSFQYSADKELIKDFNVQVKPGEMIAIVGPTGAGKTTMINLLMRFYDVDKGAIKLEGIDNRSLSRQEYRSQFGMVLQDAWLFEGTIKENLRFGKLDATDEEIIQAAKTANVDHFVRTLPGGYNMRINQEASNISLGQKQLLTIARALLSDPKILILDEATSSVDTRLEQLIQKAMDRLMEGRTSFVIAHRLSTIQEADRILVMDQGQIIEQGSHEELLEEEGFYYNLYQSQFSH